MKQTLFSAFFLITILTGAAISQTLPNGLQLPPHWRQQYEIVSEKNGLLTYRERLTNAIFTYKLFIPGHNTVNGSPKDTLWGDTLITIKTWEIDTSQYAGMFRWMGSVPVYNSSSEVLVFDSDGNGLAEIIGFRKILNDNRFTPNQFYEWNRLSRSFEKVVDFNQELRYKGGLVIMGGDVDQDGYREVYFQYGDSLRAYEASDSSRYPTEHRITHHPIKPNANTGKKIDDFDGDGALEIAVMRSVSDTNGVSLGISCFIREHLSGDTAFAVTADILYPDTIFTGFGRYATGDFDRDGKMELFTAGVMGRVFGIENVANDSFRIHWRGHLPTINAYYNTTTRDMDGDGKAEIFLCGIHGVSLPHTFITIVESCGDDCYKASVTIDIQGGWGIYGPELVPCDIDGDGVQELALDIGGWVFLFRAKGDDDYELIWAKSIQNSNGLGAGDVDGDGRDELVIAQRKYINGSAYSQSDIYKYSPPVPIDPDEPPAVPLKVALYPNFPNPFNPATKIRYHISHPAFVQLKIYDIHGKGVITLVEKRQNTGEYEVEWRGVNRKGQQVNSGVYFAKLVAGQQFATRKLVLLR